MTFSTLLLAETSHSPACSLAATPQFREVLSILQHATRARTQASLPPQPVVCLPSLLSVLYTSSNFIPSFHKENPFTFYCIDLILYPCIHGNPTMGSLAARAGCCTQAAEIPCILSLPSFNCCSALTFQKDASLLLLLCGACLCFVLTAVSSLEPLLMNAAC